MPIPQKKSDEHPAWIARFHAKYATCYPRNLGVRIMSTTLATFFAHLNRTFGAQALSFLGPKAHWAGQYSLAYPFPKEVGIDPMFERKSRYRCPRLKAGCDKPLLRYRIKTTSPVPAYGPHTQFLIIFHDFGVHLILGGHQMPQLIQRKRCGVLRAYPKPHPHLATTRELKNS